MEAVAPPAAPLNEPRGLLGSMALPSADTSPGDARRWAHDLLGWLDEETLDTLDLLTSELVTNVFLHADATEVRVDIIGGNGILRVEVTDDGSGGWEETSSDREGGRGLDIVEQLSACWGAAHGVETTVWFELKTTTRCT